MSVSQELKSCPFCAEQIQAAAVKCKHCGERLDTAQSSAPKKKLGHKRVGGKGSCLVIIGALIFFPVVLLFAYPDGSSSSSGSSATRSADGSHADMAYIIAKDHVKSALKSPSTADFPFLDFTSNHLGQDRYKVHAHVDSQNSFGATVRTDWWATMKYDGGEPASPASWTLESLVVDGKEIYKAAPKES